MTWEHTLLTICCGLPIALLLAMTGTKIYLDARYGFQLRERRRLVIEHLSQGKHLSEIAKVLAEKRFKNQIGEDFTVIDLRKEFAEELSERYQLDLFKGTQIMINGLNNKEASLSEYKAAILEIRGKPYVPDIGKLRDGETNVLIFAGAGTKFTEIFCRLIGEKKDSSSLFTSNRALVRGIGEITVPDEEEKFSDSSSRWLVVEACSVIAYD